MEEPAILLDSANADVRVEFGMARAEHAQRSATIAIAEQIAAIHATMREARDYPQLFLGPTVDAKDRDAVTFAERAAAADLAVRLSVSEQTIRAQDHQAATSIRRIPIVWAAFREGEVSAANAKVAAELAATLPDEPAVFAAFDEIIVGPAKSLAPARFATRARVLRERLNPEQLVEKHRRAMEKRGVWVEPDLDGMAWLSAYLPAADAQRIMAGLDRAALTQAAEPDETRTVAQLRADHASRLLLGKSTGHGVGVSVAVTVPVLTLLGHSDEPATLEGYGPIDAETARWFAAQAPSFARILTDPVTGTILDVDRKSYRVPADLKRWLGVRDVQCTFPGCGRRATSCDLDHTVAWADGGTTSAHNLGHLCRHHHRLKHQTGWKVSRGDDRTLPDWTSPTGYTREGDPPPF